MQGLSTDVVSHKWPIYPGFDPVKQETRKFKPELSLNIKEEITKQIQSRLVEVKQYPTWLANVVPVAKKDGKIRICVNYRDLKKAIAKDNSPLPNIDILIDNYAKHEMQSFVDCYAGYHQIHMDEENIIIKSRESLDHLTHLRKFFDHLRRYNLKLNPINYAFGVPGGKLLGFIVSRRGIELDPSKIKAIQEFLRRRQEQR